ncbi:DUF5605 domain-containing protein [Streptomyces sp. NBC_01166]|uniref:DUF5605 domain-containing protein n=1 Tax=Streptomyces sp. NBC_01166 TaxID=2903755 RepID=UPI00386CCED8|nr:DUF5605 domain-containing protein [Streptomyces sp. NBC_01166]
MTTHPATPHADHGPVRAHGTRFRHADGTPFHPWTTSVPQAGDDTLRALAASPFNKVRLLDASLPLDRLDHQVGALGALGVQAEVQLRGRDIPETVRRLAGRSNVWWCAPPDPEAQTDIQEHDHGHHPLTVHGAPDTDFGAPWITHASVAHPQTRAVSGLVRDLCKPVVVDDCGSEGDDPDDPEQALPGAELLCRIWEAVCRGGYGSHAESWGPDPWSAGGGRLSGTAVERVAFLRTVLDEAPAGLGHTPETHDASTLEAPGEYVLQYHGPHRYPRRSFALAGGPWSVEILDTWNMTVRSLDDSGGGKATVELPAEPYLAVRLRRR